MRTRLHIYMSRPKSDSIHNTTETVVSHHLHDTHEWVQNNQLARYRTVSQCVRGFKSSRHVSTDPTSRKKKTNTRVNSINENSLHNTTAHKSLERKLSFESSNHPAHKSSTKLHNKTLYHEFGQTWPQVQKQGRLP